MLLVEAFCFIGTLISFQAIYERLLEKKLPFLLCICRMKYYQELWIATIKLEYHAKLAEISTGIYAAYLRGQLSRQKFVIPFGVFNRKKCTPLVSEQKTI